MGYTADFEYDIFISYAWADNQPVGGDKGWVDHFESELTSSLTQEFGKDVITIFRDIDQTPNTRFDKNIPEQLKQSALFLALISPKFLESRWCMDEIAAYTKYMQESPHGTEVEGHKLRLFTILLSDIPYTGWPEQLHNTNPFIFYTGEKEESLSLHWEEPAYYYEIHKLKKAIKATLETHNRTGGNQLPGGPGSSGGTLTIFVAEVPEKLQYERKKVIKALQQQQISLVSRIPPPPDFNGHNEKMKEALPGTRLSIHLLSDVPGREFDDKDGIFYPAQQVKMAQDMKIQQLILLPELMETTTGIRDKKYRQWVDNLKTSSLESPVASLSYFTSKNLCSVITEKINELKEQKVSDGLTLIRTDKQDQHYAHKLAGWLIEEKKMDAEIISPRRGAGNASFLTIDEYNSAIRQIVILFGKVSLEWVNTNLELFEKKIIRMQPGLAHTLLWLYLLPPVKKSFPVDFTSFLTMYGIRILNNSTMDDIDPTTAMKLIEPPAPETEAGVRS